ncbi:MAG: pyrroloquinoline quinone biosynthesis protein PqqB [Bauldia sp.]|nr:pyrroloquinoline quinone biosynthesis protein PqqB [Bauldia sp.]
MLHVLVLGAAAGGGLPQWNCNCPVCRIARSEHPELRSTQASVAVSADSETWFLVNAAPDLRQQITDNPKLHPRHGLRHSPIAGIVLTNGDVDAIAGLLHLRESQAFTIYGHERVLSVLRDNSIFNVLDPRFVKREAIELEVSVTLRRPDGADSAIEVVPFALPGKVALYLEDEMAREPGFGTRAGDTLGLHIRNRHSGAHFYYLAACADLTPELAERVRGAPLVFFDGTLWRDDEMITQGLGTKTGKRMGHMSMSGQDGTIARFAPLGVGRKVFLHINNSNPALLPHSPERAELRQAGWEIPADGTEITL